MFTLVLCFNCLRGKIFKDSDETRIDCNVINFRNCKQEQNNCETVFWVNMNLTWRDVILRDYSKKMSRVLKIFEISYCLIVLVRVRVFDD